jgi:hypothetical protein
MEQPNDTDLTETGLAPRRSGSVLLLSLIHI